jgi:hypothetical protein
VTVIDGKDNESVEGRLRRLESATRDIEPPLGLADRLAQPFAARKRSPRGLAAVVLPLGRPALFAAALAAAASIALAMQTEQAADETIAEAFGEAWGDL